MQILPTYQQILQLPQTHEATVSDEWIDVMGHMNVAWYTVSFSSAMQSLRSSLGLDNETVKSMHVGSFAIETHTRYVSELRVGDRLQVHSRLLARSGSQKRIHAMHIMVSPEHERISATFEAIVGNVDLKSRKMAPILPAVLERMDAMIAQHQGLEWAAPVCGALRL